jgi:hypothetical protein
MVIAVLNVRLDVNISTVTLLTENVYMGVRITDYRLRTVMVRCFMIRIGLELFMEKNIDSF